MLYNKNSIIIMFDNLYNQIKHGDEEHQQWLYNKIQEFKNLNNLKNNMKATIKQTKRVSKGTMIEVLRTNAGKIFTAIANTKDKTNRVFNCNTTTKAFETNLMRQGILRVYEFKNKSYRNLNINTISSITVAGTTYKVRK